MKLDIFINRRKEKKSKKKDEIDIIIDSIEKFAPREHRPSRDVYYYNYKIMSPYLKPLSALLITLSQRDRLKSDQAAFARDLFLKLKDFYDPKNRLSMEEAVEDGSLKKKFRELFLFYYGRKEVSAQDIKGWLSGI